ncbi:hypothetical protein A0H81_11277 [Grifola frondosa]|uniref:F-box domain-containing protein n=1 Tax=Grifola frondosa TaxID=5627 RepID=A0A1C7LY45_GRIFR|nr:hypothetical protein A0H81_11277 [Grifola frondosa]
MPDDPSLQPTLAVLARTSRAFHEPAIDRLWEELYNLVPIVQCFPTDTWKEKQHCLRLDILHEVCPSYKENSRRRRMSSRSLYRAKRLDDGVFEALSLYRPVLTLFPNLRSFQWHARVGSLSFMTLILDQAKSLNLRVVAFVSRIKFTSPRLKNILLKTNYISDELENEISDAVCGLEHLQSLTWFANHSLTYNALKALAQLTYLRTLVLSWSIDQDSWFSPVASIPASFPNLRLLKILVNKVQSYLAFSGLGRFPLVEDFELTILEAPTQITVQQLFNGIPRLFNADYLSRLCINSMDLVPASALRFRGTIHSLDFHPLLVLHYLEVVDITPRFELDLDDQLMEALASAWPRLRVLRFRTDSGWNRSQLRMTLNGLIPFAKHCPELLVLGVVFNADSSSLPVDSYVMPGGSYSHSKLSRLDVGVSTVLPRDKYQVAMFLSGLFPHATITHCSPLVNTREDGDITSSGKVWEHICEIHPMFSKLRMGERKCKNKGD